MTATLETFTHEKPIGPVRSSPPIEFLVDYYLADTKKIAGRFIKRTGGSVDSTEIVSVAYYGLATAANHWYSYCVKNLFDPNRLEYFRAYASRRVQGSILDYLRSTDWATRTHRTDYKRMVEAGYSQGSTLGEVGEKTGLSADEMTAALVGVNRRPVSIEGDELDFAHERTLEDTVVSQDTERILVAGALSVIESLDFISQAVLSLHYYTNMVFKEIAPILGITSAEVRSRHNAAVLQVRQAMEDAARALPKWAHPEIGDVG